MSTVSDMDGNFAIKVKPGSKIKISYLGFKDVILPAKTGMKVQLEAADHTLKEVEIVAYGVQKKVTLTGAISSVKSDDLIRTSVGSVNNVLGGQLSGVTTVQYSGEPGSDAAEIFVRGKATWGDSAPLIQVDGVERAMGDIDPNEIESVTVLKDASATAVFGVRGANGVVLITTKRGAQGKAKISASTSWTALTPTKMVEQASSYEYANFYNQMSYNDYLQTANVAVANGKYASLDAYMADPKNAFAPSFSSGIIQKFQDGSDPIRFPSTRWADYIMKDVRTMRTEMNVHPAKKTSMIIETADAAPFQNAQVYLAKFAFATDVTFTEKYEGSTDGMVQVSTHAARGFIPMMELIDREKELARLNKEKAKAEKEMAMFGNQLNNPKFVERAPAALVEDIRAKYAKSQDKLANIEQSIQALG